MYQVVGIWVGAILGLFIICTNECSFTAALLLGVLMPFTGGIIGLILQEMFED